MVLRFTQSGGALPEDSKQAITLMRRMVQDIDRNKDNLTGDSTMYDPSVESETEQQRPRNSTYVDPGTGHPINDFDHGGDASQLVVEEEIVIPPTREEPVDQEQALQLFEEQNQYAQARDQHHSRSSARANVQPAGQMERENPYEALGMSQVLRIIEDKNRGGAPQMIQRQPDDRSGDTARSLRVLGQSPVSEVVSEEANREHIERDRIIRDQQKAWDLAQQRRNQETLRRRALNAQLRQTCLLYTSDAADE